MKTRLLFICEFCGQSSPDRDTVLSCEARHYGLTLDEYLEWKRLDEAVKRWSYTTSYNHNEDTCRSLDVAIDAVLAFEKAHHLEGRRRYG